MKNDLDRLMKEHNIELMLVTGSGRHNPAMVYFTGVAHLTQADLIKPAGKSPILFHASMERDEAQRTGISTCSIHKYPLANFLKQTQNSRIRAEALRYKKMINDMGITGGRMAVYGKKDIGWGYAIIAELIKVMPDIDFVYPEEIDILARAMITKDTFEVEEIRKMGKITTEVVSRVVDLLTTSEVIDEKLVSNGSPLTVGRVKDNINLWLSELGAENPEDTIFSLGRDAGVPHTSGNRQDVLCLGKTIVMDIFPCQAGGGYFYDFTRTWSLGYATDEVQKSYDEVLSVHDKVIEELKPGRLFSEYQDMACNLFHDFGHDTVQSDATTENGYVHSIGHGLGLNIHESPFSSSISMDRLEPGMVFTVEPGLYYPNKDYGIRIEDTVWINAEGKVEILSEYPKDLVLRME